MDSLKDKITKASMSTNARFKRKKIRSMIRDFDKISEKLKESEAKLESIEQQVPIDPMAGPCYTVQEAPLKLHAPSKNKCIEAKIAEINKKIRRVKNKKNKEHLIAKREALKTETLHARWQGPATWSTESNWNPEFRLIDGAF